MNTPDFRKTVLNRLHVILKPLGFRKKGSTFFAETNDVVLFVQRRPGLTEYQRQQFLKVLHGEDFCNSVIAASNERQKADLP